MMDEAYFQQVELAAYYDSDENLEFANGMLQMIRNDEVELNSVDFFS